MKRTRLIAIALAVLVMAAAPPMEEPGAGRSVWSRMVDGAKAFVHNPLGTAPRDPRRAKSSPAARVNRPAATATDSAKASRPKMDPAVRQASASRPDMKAAAGANDNAPPTKRAGLFSRAKRTPRTLSEYMAQEKP